jgi:hypothetical protein
MATFFGTWSMFLTIIFKPMVTGEAKVLKRLNTHVYNWVVHQLGF